MNQIYFAAQQMPQSVDQLPEDVKRLLLAQPDEVEQIQQEQSQQQQQQQQQKQQQKS